MVANDSLSIKWFLGLAADEAVPDHSTLTAFKRRLAQNGKISIFEEMLGEIVLLAQDGGVGFGSIQVMDSVHTVANVNLERDRERRGRHGKPPRDPGAGWGVKESRQVKNQKGQVVQVKERFYGYKAHVNFNAQAEMITSLRVTGGNAYDGHQLPELLEKDLGLELPVEIVTADRRDEEGENHEWLRAKGLRSAIRLNRYRTQKKDKNKELWLALQATAQYQQGLKERYKIERKFREAKQGHGLRRCRYLGTVGYTIQVFLTAMVLNLKRMVKLLTGVNFKGRARATA